MVANLCTYRLRRRQFLFFVDDKLPTPTVDFLWGGEDDSVRMEKLLKLRKWGKYDKK